VTLGSATTRFLYDGDALVAEYNGSNVMTTRHLHAAGADVPMVTFAGTNLATPRFLYADHQGSVIAAADGSGVQVALNRYAEYGIPASTNTGRFQYTGQAWLAELGMYYYKARIYSPTLGRFLQVDPVGYQDQFNLYAYVGGDPINRIDPTGLTERPEPGGCGSRIPDVNNCSGMSGVEFAESRGGAAGSNGPATYAPPGRAGGGSGGRNAQSPTVGRQYHLTSIFEPACPATDCSEDEVYAAWRGYSAPGAPYAENGNHRVVLTGGNPILQTVVPQARLIVNQTLPGHVFHPGAIIIHVVTEHGVVGARIIGFGTGPGRFINQYGGPLIFGVLASEVRARVNPNGDPELP